MNDGEIQLWDDAPRNFLFQAQIGDSEATAKAFESATHTARIRLVNQRIVQNSMEVRGAIGNYDSVSERYTLYNLQPEPAFAAGLGRELLPQDRFAPTAGMVDDVGGGFGMKTHPYHEQILVLVAARRLGRTARWISDRTKAFLSDLHGRDHISDSELALDGNGKFLAIRVRTVANIGAYSCSADVSVQHRSARKFSPASMTCSQPMWR